jgi:hypothetical protein
MSVMPIAWGRTRQVFRPDADRHQKGENLR